MHGGPRSGALVHAPHTSYALSQGLVPPWNGQIAGTSEDYVGSCDKGGPLGPQRANEKDDRMKRRLYSTALAAVMGIGATFAMAQPARADKEDTYRIATYALGAGTAYAAVKKKGTLALIGAAGTYLAYNQWKKEADERRRNERRRYGRRR
jgi:hypothetical protein